MYTEGALCSFVLCRHSCAMGSNVKDDVYDFLFKGCVYATCSISLNYWEFDRTYVMDYICCCICTFCGL